MRVTIFNRSGLASVVSRSNVTGQDSRGVAVNNGQQSAAVITSKAHLAIASGGESTSVGIGVPHDETNSARVITRNKTTGRDSDAAAIVGPGQAVDVAIDPNDEVIVMPVSPENFELIGSVDAAVDTDSEKVADHPATGE